MQSLALISGAAKGIGKACVEAFLKRGWRVAALDLDEQVRLAFSNDTDVIPIVADVSNVTQLENELRYLEQPAAALVNAAGIFPPTSLATVSAEQYRRIFEVNVLGTLLLSQAASRHMVPGGCIINLSSINAFLPRSDQIIYAASKAAITSLTRSMAADLAARGIRVNAVAPGPIATEGLSGLPGRTEEASRHVPLRRIGKASEIAELIYWLTDGEGAKFITGETIVSSGGLYMR